MEIKVGQRVKVTGEYMDRVYRAYVVTKSDKEYPLEGIVTKIKPCQSNEGKSLVTFVDEQGRTNEVDSAWLVPAILNEVVVRHDDQGIQL